MRIQNIIEQLGYPKNQAKIYLASLKMGEALVSEIAERIDYPRTTTAELLQTMHRQGLMNYYLKRNKKYWVAQNPDSLMALLKNREEMLRPALPLLHRLKRKSSAAATANCFFGPAEIKNMLADIIETKHHLHAIVCWDDFLEGLGRRTVFDFLDSLDENFLECRIICPKTQIAAAMLRKYPRPLRHVRFVPQALSIKSTCQFVYANKIAFMTFSGKNPSGIIITNPHLSQTQILLFNSLWQLSDHR